MGGHRWVRTLVRPSATHTSDTHGCQNKRAGQEGGGHNRDNELKVPHQHLMPTLRKRREGSEVDDDGDSVLRPERPDPRSEEECSDIDDLIIDESPETGPAKRPSEQNKAEKKKESPKVKVKRPWSEAERKVVKKHLGEFMAEHRVPGKEDCLRCINEGKVFGQRSWTDVKNFVRNIIVTLNTRSASRNLK
ncbi:hypothetical protein D5F01_LYC23610 [Larimichthys crocea]|uniref:Uncharacterized protein n=1 Tax=Larimichthys crocea TaxID=215358 RepID=A0A6G0HHX8_LARCR|nr:hypothetical protein D5F01_LYC23610 [Larimichthys crocea]